MNAKLVPCTGNCGVSNHIAGSEAARECGKSTSGAQPSGGTGATTGAVRSDFSGGSGSAPDELRNQDMLYETIPMTDEDYIVESILDEGIYEDAYDIPREEIEDRAALMSESDEEFMRGDIKYLAETWAETLPEDTTHVMISGDGLGWRGLQGGRVMELEEFLDNPTAAIMPRTDDVSQRWTTDDSGMLTVTQAHHDAHGEVYLFSPLSDEDYESIYGMDDNTMDYWGRSWNPASGEYEQARTLERRSDPL